MAFLPWEAFYLQFRSHRSKVTFRWLNSIRPKRHDTRVTILIRFRPVLQQSLGISIYQPVSDRMLITGIRKRQTGCTKIKFLSEQLRADANPEVPERKSVLTSQSQRKKYEDKIIFPARKPHGWREYTAPQVFSLCAMCNGEASFTLRSYLFPRTELPL